MIGILMIGEATFVAAVALVIVIQGGHLGHFSAVWFSLAWAVIGIIWAVWWGRRRRLASISLSAEV